MRIAGRSASCSPARRRGARERRDRFRGAGDRRRPVRQPVARRADRGDRVARAALPPVGGRFDALRRVALRARRARRRPRSATVALGGRHVAPPAFFGAGGGQARAASIDAVASTRGATRPRHRGRCTCPRRRGGRSAGARRAVHLAHHAARGTCARHHAGVAARRGRPHGALLAVRLARGWPHPARRDVVVARVRLSGAGLRARRRPARAGLPPQSRSLLPLALAERAAAPTPRVGRRRTRSRTCAAATSGPTRSRASSRRSPRSTPPRGSSSARSPPSARLHATTAWSRGPVGRRSGPPCWRTWLAGWRSRAPLAAPSVPGSRIRSCCASSGCSTGGPRRVRLSRPALGGAIMLLALIAFTGASRIAGARLRAGQRAAGARTGGGRVAALRGAESRRPDDLHRGAPCGGCRQGSPPTTATWARCARKVVGARRRSERRDVRPDGGCRREARARSSFFPRRGIPGPRKRSRGWR